MRQTQVVLCWREIKPCANFSFLRAGVIPILRLEVEHCSFLVAELISLHAASLTPRWARRAFYTGGMAVSEVIHSSWVEPLSPVFDQIASLGEMLRSENAAKRGYLPAGSDVLRAFTYPFDAVRVLIVGQDPYPTPGHAMGLSFSVQPHVRPLPRSLVNIYRELHDDLAITPPAHGCLTAWSEQGVMLLNRVLTTQPGKPNAHRGRGWEEVTECAIRALVARQRPLVAILWGRQAQQLTPLLSADHVRMIASPHPSPLSASRGFFGSRPFSRANTALVELGGTPVNWQLPQQVAA